MSTISTNTKYQAFKQNLQQTPKIWLIAGVAAFIVSNHLKTLLQLNQKVIDLDNFSTSYQHNLDKVQSQATKDQWQRFTSIKGDTCDLPSCKQACKGVDYVQHQAALGSVPCSIEDLICERTTPVFTNEPSPSSRTNYARLCGTNHPRHCERSEAIQEVPSASVPKTLDCHVVTLLAETEAEVRTKIIKHAKPKLGAAKPVYRVFRVGDVKHPQVDTGKAARLSGYLPTHTIRHGLNKALVCYEGNAWKLTMYEGNA